MNDKFERLESIAVYSASFTLRCDNYAIEDKEGYDQLAASSPYLANEPFIYGIYVTIGTCSRHQGELWAKYRGAMPNNISII